MTKRKNNKRALTLSLLSLLLCMAMLVGSTFAWFTDNATTAVNTIQAGTLNIELLDGNTDKANSLEGKTLTFAKAEGAPEDEEVLFEPGAKYSLQQVYLHNAGNLHAKYQVVISGIDGSSKLAEVLDVYVAGTKVGTLAQLAAQQTGIVKANTIAPKAYDTFGTIELEMQTTAGNEYQGLSLKGIAITVQATQTTVEYDSEDNQYDAGATYDELVAVKSQDELNTAIAGAQGTTTVVLPEGEYKLPSLTNKEVTVSGTKDTVIDLTNAVAATGSTVTMEGITVNVDGDGTYKGIQHAEKVVYKNVTFNGTQFLYSDAEFVNCTFNVSGDKYNIWTYGNDATFTNCTFNCDGKAVLQYHEGTLTATVTFNNCTFNDNGTVSGKAAIEVGESANGNQATYTINVNSCTVNGFETTAQSTSTYGGTNLGTAVWGNKNLMPADRLHVFIDGVEAY